MVIALAAIGWTVGCGAKSSTVLLICRDPVTKACVACPDTHVCVDPVTCSIVDCNVDVAFSKPDAVAEVADATPTDAKVDTAVADQQVADSQVDTAAVLVPDTAPDVPADISTGPCKPGAVRCQGNTIQVCKPGDVWADDKTCAADLECKLGVCACKDPCPALNLVECLSGVPAIRTCSWTGSGCLSWGLPIACKPGEVCELGQCKAPGPCTPGCPPGKVCQGGVCADAPCNPACPTGQTCQSGVCVPKGGGVLTCSQIAACIGNCPATDGACPDNCKAQGSDAGLSTLAAYQGCIKAICKSLADQGKINETMLCIYSNCATEQAACIGSGSGDCKKTSDCMATCGGSATCVNNCNAGASLQGAKDYYGLLTCIDDVCAGLTGQAQLNCAQTGCKMLWDKCFSGGSGGPALYSTCLQVAQCQAKCAGDVACAKACKAAATPAAQAAVDAFVICRDNKCGAWCSGANQNNCMTCVQQYCPNELAACSI